MLSRQIRELQTYIPFIPSFKYSALNFVSSRFGWRVDRDFLFLNRLRPFRLAVDVGGNWGQSIVALARTARPERTISFEPNALLAARLARRYVRDERVEIRSCALGEEIGQFVLHVPYYRSFPFDGLASIDKQEAVSFLGKKWLARFDDAKLSSRAFAVQVSRLDDFALAPDVVKIDVQGLETAVVRGGLETLSRHRPVTIIENPSAELCAMMAEIRLNPYYFDGTDLHSYRRQWKNALFLTPEHIERAQSTRRARHAALYSENPSVLTVNS